MSVERGFLLGDEDLKRRRIIQALMCHFEVERSEAGQFPDARAALEGLKAEGLVEETEAKWMATPLGRLFIRLIAASFDAYLKKGNYSKAI